MTDRWLGIVSLVFSLLIPFVVFVARHWIVARIARGVQHQFDRQIEEVRAELRLSEERLKSELRDREAEIAALRNNVLAGSAGRQALLDKRRFDAVEKVWAAVNDLHPLKVLSSMMAVLNFKAIARDASNPKIQQFMSMVGGELPNVKDLKNVARDEQPFMPDLAWAYFEAYRTILYSNFARFSVLKAGVDEPEKLLTMENTRKVLKAALPHQSAWIDQNEPETYHYLLDEIERNLLMQLRKILEGQDADQAAAARAREIMDAVRQANKDQVEKAAGRN